MNQRVTIVDVAREAGVSISSVSAALNDAPGVSDATRRRVREVAGRLGWVPSVRGRSLSSRRSHTLGLVLQRPAGVLGADPFFSAFIGGIESVLSDADYSLLLQVSDPEHAVHRLDVLARSHAVDGVFLTDVAVDDPRPPMAARLGLPAVTVNAPDSDGVAGVVQDDQAGLRLLVEELVRLGHRRIAHVSGTPGLVHTAQREQVWRQVLAASGLASDLLVSGDFSTESGARAASELLGGEDPPTAVVCANDLMAIGFMAAAAGRGVRVPEQVSVTGFDGIQLGEYLQPPLTTVVTDPAELGRRAASLLLACVEGADADRVAIPPARPVWRGSHAPAPAR